MNPNEIVVFCEYCGCPTKLNQDVRAQRRVALAALESDRICSRATLALGIVGHLDANQTVPFAEAEATALFHSSIVYALWSTWGKNEPIAAYWNFYMPRLQKKIQERFGDVCLNQFNAIFKSREAEFMEEVRRITAAAAAATGGNPALAGPANLAPMLALGAKWVRRMRGTDSTELANTAPPPTEIPLTSSIIQLVMSSVTSEGELFRATLPLFQ